MIRDLTDEEARAALVLKWGEVPQDVIPAWVAEMDYAVAPVVLDAVRDAVERNMTGYPAFEQDGGAIGTAYAGWARRHFGQTVNPAQVLPVVDVTAGVRVVLDVLCDDAPVALPTPAYHPQFGVVPVTGREVIEVRVDPDADSGMFDLDRLEDAYRRGARTLLLTNPHNPLGHVHTHDELEAIRDLTVQYGARVIADEIHAPLVPGAECGPWRRRTSRGSTCGLRPRRSGRRRARARPRPAGTRAPLPAGGRRACPGQHRDEPRAADRDRRPGGVRARLS